MLKKIETIFGILKDFVLLIILTIKNFFKNNYKIIINTKYGKVTVGLMYKTLNGKLYQKLFMIVLAIILNYYGIQVPI